MSRSAAAFILLATVALLLTCCAGNAMAQAASGADSPTSGALSNSPWYDADRGQVVPVGVKTVEDDTIHRDSRWLPQPERVKQNTNVGGTGGGTGGNRGGLFGSGLTIGNLFGWMLLILVVVGTIGGILYAMSRTESDPTGRASAAGGNLISGTDEQIMERMKHLPPELRRSDVNLRGEAERLMQQGLFDQAIILLFGHQLLLLDRAGMLRLNRGKTNRRYIREVRAVDRTTADQLASTVNAFEWSYFGRHELTAEQFQDLWESNQQLEQAVVRRQEAAA